MNFGPEQREPTHILTIEVPLYLADAGTFAYHPVQDALNIIMSLSRIAAAGVYCGDVNVSLDPVAE
jgi:hypothetical protein